MATTSSTSAAPKKPTLSKEAAASLDGVRKAHEKRKKAVAANEKPPEFYQAVEADRIRQAAKMRDRFGDKAAMGRAIDANLADLARRGVNISEADYRAALADLIGE